MGGAGEFGDGLPMASRERGKIMIGSNDKSGGVYSGWGSCVHMNRMYSGFKSHFML